MAVQLRLLSRDSALGAGSVRTTLEYRLKHHFAVSSDARGVERLFPPDLPQSRRVIRTRAYRGALGYPYARNLTPTRSGANVLRFR